ncbi:MAG TPA: hypothetical protein VNG33_13630, partial [Polyangiaceae bacterium]|nr:hypothetical protein [Polyangiaceae bacterium]
IGIYIDPGTRAHMIGCLLNANFWGEVRPLLSTKAREALREVVSYFASERELLPLTQEEADQMLALASEGL